MYQYPGNKMRVKYATQLLSNTVAKALDYLRESGVPQFQGSKPTADFIRNMDQCFDLQNSSSKFGRNLKGPTDPKNFALMDDLTSYISSLTDMKGKSLLSTQKKTGFLGECLQKF